jgi:hypothetical protein
VCGRRQKGKFAGEVAGRRVRTGHAHDFDFLAGNLARRKIDDLLLSYHFCKRHLTRVSRRPDRATLVVFDSPTKTRHIDADLATRSSRTFIDQGKPVARQGRKAMGLIVRLPGCHK